MAKKKRIEGPTPAGGAYAEMIFLNDAKEVVDEKEAAKCSIRECDEDGNLIMETWGIINNEASE